jgi:NADPH:quinone reductase-like Zn-dependent oxidoreductase
MTKMKAVVCTKYGDPDVLQIRNVTKPIPKDNEVLVKIYATAVTATDCVIRGLSIPGGYTFPLLQLMRFGMRIAIGFSKPRNPILGLVFSGVVESVGKQIKTFEAGDEVFGFTGNSRGAYADYKSVSAKEIEVGEVVLKPKNASHDDTVAIVYGGVLAMHFMRTANLQKGHKVLIYGASGAIGTMAIQLAKQCDAEVTAVCSTKNFDLVVSLGADKIIDYTKEYSTNQLEQYDFILDAVGKNKTSNFKDACKKSLTANGNYVSVDDGLLKIQPDYLHRLSAMFESGHIEGIIDKQYPLEDIVIAHEYVDKGHKKGNVIINVN